MWVSQSDTVVQAQGGEPRWAVVHGVYSAYANGEQRYYVYTVDTHTGNVVNHVTTPRWKK